MDIIVSNEAANWYIKELNLKPGDSIKLFGKVYGNMDGFSIAIAKMEPSRPLFNVEVNGINFYAEKNDEWFFTNKIIKVTMDDILDEPKFEFEVIK